MPDAVPARPSRWGQRLLLLALSTLFALILAEAGLRAYFWSKGIGRKDVREILERSKSTDLPELHGGAGLFGRMEPSPYPDVVYQLKPHLKGTLRGAVIETNRYGMRGPDIEKDKPAKTYRIVGIGDSHMFGWAVEQGEEYLRLLEAKLDAHATDGWHFEVLNFGTPGYNTVMEVATFEHRALELEPDRVLLHFVGNDLIPPHFLQPPPGLAPSRWYLVEIAKGLAAPPPQAGANELEGGDEESGEEDDAGAPDAEGAGGAAGGSRSQYAHLRGRQAFKNALVRLAELTRSRSIPVLLFELGTKSDLRKFARDQGLALGFDFLDVQPSFGVLALERNIQPGAEFKKSFVRDGHPAPLGHIAYARALFCELQRQGVPHLAPAPEECAWQKLIAGAANPAPTAASLPGAESPAQAP